MWNLRLFCAKIEKNKKELKSHLFTRTATYVIECQAVALRCKASRMCKKGLVEEEEEVSEIWIFIWRYLAILITKALSKAGVPNLWDVRGLKVVFTWVHLYQWGTQLTQNGWKPLI